MAIWTGLNCGAGRDIPANIPALMADDVDECASGVNGKTPETEDSKF